jgi:hypothetical protein
MIHDGFDMNDASTIIGQELQIDNVTCKQMYTVMEGSSKNVGEQMTIEGGSKDSEELFTMVEQTKINILCGFDDARNEESNPEEVEIYDGSIGYESLSGNCDSSDSSIKISTKCLKKITIPSDDDSDEEDSASESDESKSSKSHFS